VINELPRHKRVCSQAGGRRAFFCAQDNEKGAPSEKGRQSGRVGFNRQADAGPAADAISRAGKSTLLRFSLSATILLNKNML
jgi:hypothetical protein